MDVLIDQHALVHGLTEDEIAYAWNNALVRLQRAAPTKKLLLL